MVADLMPEYRAQIGVKKRRMSRAHMAKTNLLERQCWKALRKS